MDIPRSIIDILAEHADEDVPPGVEKELARAADIVTTVTVAMKTDPHLSAKFIHHADEKSQDESLPQEERDHYRFDMHLVLAVIAKRAKDGDPEALLAGLSL